MLKNNLGFTQQFCSGFTLLELILVIAITAIIIGLGFPIFGNFYLQEEVQSTSYQLLQNLRWAQAKTLAGEADEQYGLYFDFDNKQYILFQGDSYDPGADYLIPQKYSSAINLSIDFGPEPEIVFARLTGEPSNTGEITITTGDITMVININKVGKIEIE